MVFYMSVLGSSPTTGTKSFCFVDLHTFVCLRTQKYALLYTVSCTKPCTNLYELVRTCTRDPPPSIEDGGSSLHDPVTIHNLAGAVPNVQYLPIDRARQMAVHSDD